MRALNGLPGVELPRSIHRFLVRMPPDCGWIKQHVRPTHTGKPRAFRIPLIPAHKSADSAVLSIEIQKTRVAWSEIKFFIIQRIVRDVHLAVDAKQSAVRVQNRGRIVMQTRAPRRSNSDATIATLDSAASSDKAAVEGPEIGSAKSNNSAFSSRQKYCDRNNSCKQMICAPLPAASPNAGFGLGHIFIRLRCAAHLHQADAKLFVHSNSIVHAEKGLSSSCGRLSLAHSSDCARSERRSRFHARRRL